MTLETTTNGDANASSSPSLKLEAKRVKLRWDDDAGEYVARDDDPKPEVSKEVDPFAISVVRRFVPCGRNHNVVEEIHLHSPFIIELVKSVMKGNRGMNWKADPIKVSDTQCVLVNRANGYTRSILIHSWHIWSFLENHCSR